MEIDLTRIIIAIIEFILLGIGGFWTYKLTPYIKEKLDNEKAQKVLFALGKIKQENEIAYDIVVKAVRSAAEKLWQERGSIKRAEAYKYTKEELAKYDLTFDEKVIDTLINSAVTEFIRPNENADKLLEQNVDKGLIASDK